MALHISMIIEMNAHKVHDIPKQETQKLNYHIKNINYQITQIPLPLFVMNQKGVKYTRDKKK